MNCGMYGSVNPLDRAMTSICEVYEYDSDK